MKMKHTLITIFLTLVATTTWAQEQQQDTTTVKKEKKEKKLYLWGFISDSFTKAYVPDVKVVVLRADSSLVDSAEVSNGYGSFKTTEYYLQVPAKPAKYIIKATHPDYETVCKNYEIKYVARNRDFEVPAIRMKRIQRSNYDKDGGSLQEVVVKATKVKMVYKGDTIVFNADAFNIPEGSMLDGLIKQLPGVELKDNGEIYVNGKKIENLTLNGADFFKGKNKMMLENLPYYTVKNVQVFNKRTPKSEFLGRDIEEKEYTMDVVLKKEYRVGGKQQELNLDLNSALRAWSPFILIFVLLLFTSKLFPFINGPLSTIASKINIYVGEDAAPTSFTWINTPGVWIIISGIIGGLIQGASLSKIFSVLVNTVKKNVKTIVTICSVLATAKIMVHSGMTTDVADVLVTVTGRFFPLFAPMVGVLGAFVTGSGTSTAVLFGPLQAASASQLGLSPEWLCAANLLGAGIGKMIAPSNIALATASSGMTGRENEILGGIFKYCILYAVLGGIICFALA